MRRNTPVYKYWAVDCGHGMFHVQQRTVLAGRTGVYSLFFQYDMIRVFDRKNRRRESYSHFIGR